MKSYWSRHPGADALDELQGLVNELESLLAASKDLALDEAPALKARLNALLDSSRGLRNRLLRQGSQALQQGGEYVHEHPLYTAAALALACGALVCLWRHGR